MTVSDIASEPLSTDGAIRCGSCSKGRDEVHAMFEGRSAFVCNECVMLFTEEVAERCEGG